MADVMYKDEVLSVDSVLQEQTDLKDKIEKIQKEKEESLKELLKQQAKLADKLEKVREAEQQPELDKIKDSLDSFVEKYGRNKREVVMDLAIEVAPPSFRRQLRTAKKEMLKTKTAKKSSKSSLTPHADISINGRFNTEKAFACKEFKDDMLQTSQSPKAMEEKWGINGSAYRRARQHIMAETEVEGFSKNVKQ